MYSAMHTRPAHKRRNQSGVNPTICHWPPASRQVDQVNCSQPRRPRRSCLALAALTAANTGLHRPIHASRPTARPTMQTHGAARQTQPRHATRRRNKLFTSASTGQPRARLHANPSQGPPKGNHTARSRRIHARARAQRRGRAGAGARRAVPRKHKTAARKSRAQRGDARARSSHAAASAGGEDASGTGGAQASPSERSAWPTAKHLQPKHKDARAATACAAPPSPPQRITHPPDDSH